MVRIVFVLLLCLLSLPQPVLAEKRVAFVVGIDKYDNLSKDAQLDKARSDARAVARLLEDLGFDLIAKEDVTRSAFNSHWQDFLNKLTPGDTAAFYFAGHGVEFGGRTYLLPRDVPSLKPGRDELLRREALSLQEFLADLKERGTRLNLVILDACRENPFEQVAGRSVGGRRGLAITEPPEGTFIMYSAGTGETALDVLDETDRDPNSVYTRHLLPLLRTPGLSLTEVAEQVRVSVRGMAATVQHRQTPAYYNQVLGRVCLAGGDCSRHVAAAPAQSTEAERAWDRTKDTTSAAVLEAFIRRFGHTYYADLAKARLAELKGAETAKQTAEAAKTNAEKEAPAKWTLGAVRMRQPLLEEEERKRVEAEAAEEAKKKAYNEARGKAKIGLRLTDFRAEAKRKADAEAARRDPALSVEPGSGASFRDQLVDGQPCPYCPEMAVLPAGEYKIGPPPSDAGRNNMEGPQLRVKIDRPFALGKFEVTFAEWEACAASGGCTREQGDRSQGKDRRPAINLSWQGAKEYVKWLSDKTGKHYLLLNDVAWENGHNPVAWDDQVGFRVARKL